MKIRPRKPYPAVCGNPLDSCLWRATSNGEAGPGRSQGIEVVEWGAVGPSPDAEANEQALARGHHVRKDWAWKY